MMVTVLRLVVMKFCSWLPSARPPQTSTMAVQGLLPSSMRLTISWSYPVRNMLARITVTMGAITQLLKSVSTMGLGFSASFLSSSSLRFRSAGYIMRNRHTPMGTLIPLICQPSIAWLSPGRYCDSIRPMPMQAMTQNAKYLSKAPSFALFSPILLFSTDSRNETYKHI